MTAFKAPPLLASQVDDILPGDASYGADSRQIAAAQRKDLDITKSQEAELSEGLGNVVRVPTKGGTGVSQAPAIDAIRKDASMASEQPLVALQGQPQGAVFASHNSDADGIRIHLMEAVRQAREVLRNCKPMQQSTADDYACICSQDKASHQKNQGFGEELAAPRCWPGTGDHAGSAR